MFWEFHECIGSNMNSLRVECIGGYVNALGIT